MGQHVTVRLRDKEFTPEQLSERSDLYLTFDVHVPERLSHEERELYEQLRELSRDEPRRKRK